MPLNLHVGLTKKAGLPNYGSVGASCHVEFELDAGLMTGDPDRFRDQVRLAFETCAQAVQAELARHSSSAEAPAPPTTATNGSVTTPEPGHPVPAANGHTDPPADRPNRSKSNGRKATDSQVRAIYAISHRLRLNVPQQLQSQFGINRPEDLTLSRASQFIDELRNLEERAEGGEQR